MSEETVVAVFDTAEQADAAVRDLRDANVPDPSISRHARTASGMTPAGDPADMDADAQVEPPREGGFWSRLFGGEQTYRSDSHYDHEVYDRSIAGGSTVVSVKIQDDMVGRVTEILDRHNPIDIEERATGYGLSGAARDPGVPTAGPLAPGLEETAYDAPVARNASADLTDRSTPGAPAYETTGSDLTETTGTRAGDLLATGGPARPVAEQDRDGNWDRDQGEDGTDTLRLAEERLQIGKRLINRGTTRVRRYVVETPVEEQVTLHDERVTLDRRPVSDRMAAADADFTERTIEMSETAEEAVVTKEAYVTEEVRLRREAVDRVETVRETVRREDVEVEKVPQDRAAQDRATEDRVPPRR